jgi:hypothetical protein
MSRDRTRRSFHAFPNRTWQRPLLRRAVIAWAGQLLINQAILIPKWSSFSLWVSYTPHEVQ